MFYKITTAGPMSAELSCTQTSKEALAAGLEMVRSGRRHPMVETPGGRILQFERFALEYCNVRIGTDVQGPASKAKRHRP